MTPGGVEWSAQFTSSPQAAAASPATAETAQSHRNTLMALLKAFMRSELDHLNDAAATNGAHGGQLLDGFFELVASDARILHVELGRVSA